VSFSHAYNKSISPGSIARSDNWVPVSFMVVELEVEKLGSGG
jgi:hypothetical protein